MKNNYIYVFLFALLTLLFSSCKKDHETVEDNNTNNEYKPTPYVIQIPYRFPTTIYVPADNPMTVEGIELGRLLFYDGRLSGRIEPDSLMSCATCHIQSKSFECGIDSNRFNVWGHPRGITGINTPHVMLPLINLVWNPNTYLWNGKVNKLENLTWMGILAPHEMKGDTNKVKALFQSITGYPPLFKKAFGSDQITIVNMGKAISQFLRTLISSNSKFDKYLRGETQLTPQELQGFVLFTTEE
ncbi:MAG TPA: cytochrome-c peroxidase, partial [Bacteroidales bacterium]|nr:cytochrome-c peroxidase [Bacteroidales bacterium]